MQWTERIGRRIKLRDLHVLHAVVQSGSMTKAAKDLAISVPVVSKAISDLEHTVRVRLLDRSPQGVEPTAYGRALLQRSHAAFDELRQGVRDIEFLADPTAGEVRIGSTQPLAASFVSAVIDRLSRRHPRIVFHVVTKDNTELLDRELNERRIDLVIIRKFGPIPGEQWSFESLYENPYVVAAGVQSPWARRRSIELSELTNEMWALPSPDSAVGAFAVEAFRASGLNYPRSTVVAFAYDLRTNLLRTGRYLTILPQSVLRFPVKHPFVRELPVKLPISSGPIGILTLKNRTLNPVAQLFIDCAHQVAKPQVKGA
jgi:DNA-binding transcriptional LysR family regulator